MENNNNTELYYLQGMTNSQINEIMSSDDPESFEFQEDNNLFNELDTYIEPDEEILKQIEETAEYGEEEFENE